ncbi:MAG: FKBP-type peptidyl-prolyl cis-trans isomerase [Bacteroidales bacterium]|jgi:FKBP-type peptidyl-prolyl cis-trans isomerase|nr:FKBP-type peptidyl-prolyl cis-trans isomerase [Bacteroidales bacterium]
MGIRQILNNIFLLCTLFVLVACSGDEQPTAHVYPVATPSYTTQDNVVANKEIVRREAEDAALLAARYGWDLQRTETGLCYQIVNPKNGGVKPKPRDRVQLKGKICTPKGDVVYDYKKDGIKEFVVDGSEDAVGLHELVQLLKTGQKVNAIIPSYLAYGINGNGGRIPAYSALVCELELVNIN